MKQRVFKESHKNILNKTKTPRKEVSSKSRKLQNSKGKATETRGEKGKRLMHAKRWRFQYSTKNIERCVFDNQGSIENKPLNEFCKYILKNGDKNELILCLLKAKSSAWFQQFHFIKQESLESLKQVTESRPLNIQGALRELGSGYRVLYDHYAVENHPQNEHKLSQKSTSLSLPDNDEQSSGERYSDKTEESEHEEIFQSPKSKSSSPERPQKIDSFATRLNQRQLISNWLLRIFRGETINQIKKDLGQKGDPNLAWTFMQNLGLLKKAQFDNSPFQSNHEQILGKRQSEGQKDEEDDEFEVYEGSEKSEEIEGEKPKKFLVLEDEEGGKKIVNSPEKDKRTERKVKANPMEHDLLADSIAYYRSVPHFNETIRSLYLFQKELAAFEETLTPEEVKTIEDAMDTGFNPIHYIYKYKLGEKTLANIRGGIYKKCLNTPSIELIYRYIVQHLQKKKSERERDEDNNENIEQ